MHDTQSLRLIQVFKIALCLMSALGFLVVTIASVFRLHDVVQQIALRYDSNDDLTRDSFTISI